jgi:hypothetical protein
VCAVSSHTVRRLWEIVKFSSQRAATDDNTSRTFKPCQCATLFLSANLLIASSAVYMTDTALIRTSSSDNDQGLETHGYMFVKCLRVAQSGSDGITGSTVIPVTGRGDP